jgi:hypothetical protein
MNRCFDHEVAIAEGGFRRRGPRYRRGGTAECLPRRSSMKAVKNGKRSADAAAEQSPGNPADGCSLWLRTLQPRSRSARSRGKKDSPRASVPAADEHLPSSAHSLRNGTIKSCIPTVSFGWEFCRADVIETERIDRWQRSALRPAKVSATRCASYAYCPRRRS